MEYYAENGTIVQRINKLVQQIEMYCRTYVQYVSHSIDIMMECSFQSSFH